MVQSLYYKDKDELQNKKNKKNCNLGCVVDLVNLVRYHYIIYDKKDEARHKIIFYVLSTKILFRVV